MDGHEVPGPRCLRTFGCFFLMVNVGTSDRDPGGPTLLQGSRPPQRLHGGGDSLAGEVWI